MTLRFLHTGVRVCRRHPFVGLQSVPLCISAAFSSFCHPLMDFWLTASFWFLQILCCEASEHRYIFFEALFGFLLDVDLGEDNWMLNFLKGQQAVSHASALFHILTSNVDFNSSLCLLKCFQLIKITATLVGVNIHHCGFDLYFSNGITICNFVYLLAS